MMNNVDSIQEHFAHSTKPLTGELEAPSRRNPEKIEATRVMLLGYDNEQVTVALRTALNYEDLFKATLNDWDGAPAFVADNGSGKIPVSSIVDDATDQEVWSCGRIKEPKGDKSVARLAFEKGRDIRTLATLVTNIREVEDVDKVVKGLEDFKSKYFADPENPITELKVEFGGYPQGLIGEIHYKPTPAPAPAPVVVEAPVAEESPLELHVGHSLSGHSAIEAIKQSADSRVTLEREPHEVSTDAADDDFTPDATGADDFDHGDYDAIEPQTERVLETETGQVVHFGEVRDEESHSLQSVDEPQKTFAESIEEAMDREPDIIIEGSISDYLEKVGESINTEALFIQGSDPANNMSVFPASSGDPVQFEVVAEGTGSSQYVEGLPEDAIVSDLSGASEGGQDRDHHSGTGDELDPLGLLDDNDSYPESDEDDDDDPVEPFHFQSQATENELSEAHHINDLSTPVTETAIQGSDPVHEVEVSSGSDDQDDDDDPVEPSHFQVAEPEAHEAPDVITPDSNDEGAGQPELAAPSDELEAHQELVEATTEVEASESARPSFMDFLDSLGTPEPAKTEDVKQETPVVDIFAWLESPDDDNEGAETKTQEASN